jgi:probable phosphoglycerate mutase
VARLLLIRHAPTPITGKLLTGRLAGYPLDEKGLAIAAELAERLAGLRLAAVYASPLERTWQTAQAVASVHGLKPIRHAGLLEVDYGRWSGRSLASLRRLSGWKTVIVAPSRMTFPEGESMLAAQMRVVTACEEVAARHPKATVALVAHADPIKAALSHYLGQPFDLFQRIGCGPASVSVVDLAPAAPPRVVAVNTNGDRTQWP